jgi:hypothetical protein
MSLRCPSLPKSGRGLPHSKTLRDHFSAPGVPPGFGLRESSTAFEQASQAALFVRAGKETLFIGPIRNSTFEPGTFIFKRCQKRCPKS